MTTATVHQNGNGTSNGFARITPAESQVDKLWESNGGFYSLAHYCKTAAQAQGHAKGKMTIERSELDRYNRWSEASILGRRMLAIQDFPSLSRSISSPDGMYELTDVDGGAVIPPGFVREVWDKARFRDTPLSRARSVTVNSNIGIMPGIAETSRVDGSRFGGLLSYWEAEAQQLVNTHPKLLTEQFRLKKLTAMVPVTDELFEDSGLLDSFLTETVAKEFMFQTNEAMINGNGAGPIAGRRGGASDAYRKQGPRPGDWHGLMVEPDEHVDAIARGQPREHGVVRSRGYRS